MHGELIDWSDYRSVRLHPLVILGYRSLFMNVLGLILTHTVVRCVARRRAPRDVPVAITLVVSLCIITTFAVDGFCNLMLVSQLGLDTEKYSDTFGKILTDMSGGGSFDLEMGASTRRVQARVAEMSSGLKAGLVAGMGAGMAGEEGGGPSAGNAVPGMVLDPEPDIDDLANML